MNTHKITVLNKILKSTVSIFLVLVTLALIAGCSSDSYDDFDTSQNYLCSDPNVYKLLNVKENYEYQDQELNSLIDEIKEIKYISGYDDFDNYDIYSQPSLELSEILSLDISFNDEDYPINYDWYDGTIDKDLLYNRILENNINAGIENRAEVLEIIRIFSNVINKNVDYIKSKNKDFKFNIAFYNLNNLILDITDKEDFQAYYISDDNKIEVNYYYVKEYGLLKNTISHECFHLLFNRCINCSSFYHNGNSLDYSFSVESPLIHTFLVEIITENFSFEAFDQTPTDLYDTEREHLNLICESTDTDIDYYINAMLTSDSMKTVEAFEPELRNINFVYSILNAIDKSCCYGYFDDNWNYDLFRTASFRYASIGLLKNKYIKLMKQISNGTISKTDADLEINRIINSFDELCPEMTINDNYSACVRELNSTFNKITAV